MIRRETRGVNEHTACRRLLKFMKANLDVFRLSVNHHVYIKYPMMSEEHLKPWLSTNYSTSLLLYLLLLLSYTRDLVRLKRCPGQLELQQGGR